MVLGEFVTVQKLSPRCLALWRTILERVPRALLLFSPSSAGEEPGFRRQLAGHGIDPARAAFVARGVDEASAQARYALVDLVLDTLPYTGGDTTLAALASGIPVITLAGTRHAERMSASILLHVDLPELVVTREHDYVERAVDLATDVARRAQMAARVAAKFASAAATFPARYTHDLERALEAAMAAPSRAPPETFPCTFTFSASAALSWAGSRRSRKSAGHKVTGCDAQRLSADEHPACGARHRAHRRL